jgi:hypothetical protein
MCKREVDMNSEQLFSELSIKTDSDFVLCAIGPRIHHASLQIDFTIVLVPEQLKFNRNHCIDGKLLIGKQPNAAYGKILRHAPETTVAVEAKIDFTIKDNTIVFATFLHDTRLCEIHRAH